MIGMPSYASDGDCDGGGPGAQELVTRLCLLRPSAPRRRRRRKGFRRLYYWASDDGGPGSEFRPAPGRHMW
jgi:hypothetical protein